MITGTIIIIYLILLVFVIGILGFYLVGLWKLFEKAGRNGWEALVPFYNTWVLTEISGVAWWYALIIIFSNLSILGSDELGAVLNLVALVAEFFIFYNLSKKFHKDVVIAILLVAFPFVMIPLMGLSKDFQYDKDVFVSENGPIGEHKNNENNYKENSNNENRYDKSTYSSDSVNVKEEDINSQNTDDTINGSREINYCSNCGKKIIIGAKFCGNCGKEIDE